MSALIIPDLREATTSGTAIGIGWISSSARKALSMSPNHVINLFFLSSSKW
jgi:hypothetical protein